VFPNSSPQQPATAKNPGVFQIIYDPDKEATSHRCQGEFPIAALMNALIMAILVYGNQQMAAMLGAMQEQHHKRIVAPDGSPLPKLTP
jgi:hypothetical protein